jgi:hypothetical protein
MKPQSENSEPVSQLRQCLKCGRWKLLGKGWFLCTECRDINSRTYDESDRYVSHTNELIRSNILKTEIERE